MRVLVACEYSGVVRDAFLALGHDAMSCDLLPTDVPGPHYQGDVFDVIRDGWDLMIAHPPCTFLSKSGVRWLTEQPGRMDKMRAGALFFKALLEADIPQIAVENPGMHRFAMEIIGKRADQYVDPWMFGHPEMKHTGLWLKGLSALVPTDDVRALMMTLPIKERQRVWYLPPGPNRWKLRSTTYVGIAAAMADQWSQPDLFTAVAS